MRPLIVGVVHGLAGSAAVALLVLATIGNTGWAILYLLVFGIGTIVGMMLITAGIAWPFAYAGATVRRLPHRLRVASGRHQPGGRVGAGLSDRRGGRAVRRRTRAGRRGSIRPCIEPGGDHTGVAEGA